MFDIMSVIIYIESLNAFLKELCFSVLQNYLLLQFLTELDNSFCKMVVRGVATKLS